MAQVPVLASFDISASHQVPDFPAAKARDASFAFVKDTAGLGYVDPNHLRTTARGSPTA